MDECRALQLFAVQLLLTPSRRTSFFGQGTYRITDHVNWNIKGTYTKRRSVNQAAPEPIFLGSEAGSGGLADFVGIDATNPYNPFGTISPEGSFITRRPVEGGPRIFTQDVDTSYFTTGLNGDFSAGERQFFWDVNFVTGENSATQNVRGTYNIAHIQRALGPVADCTAPCVPLDFFGGPGSITQDMLDYILFNEVDRSKQKLTTWTANISGDLIEMPAGALAFASGYEHRKQSGSYTPDSVVTAGESNGVPSGPTSGDYSVNEFYLELNAPLLADMAFAKHLDLSVASRYSDYSNFGSTTNSKIGLRWQLSDDLTLRGTWAEGFRAPSIGELYGTFARFDAQIQDPCNGATGQQGANCEALGVPNPATFEQANAQISVVTGGNSTLQPETSKSLTLGAVYSPSWGENTSWSQKLDFEVTYYNIKIKDAIQASDAQTQLRALRGDAGSDLLRRHQPFVGRQHQWLRQHPVQPRQDQHQGRRSRHQLARQRDRYRYLRGESVGNARFKLRGDRHRFGSLRTARGRCRSQRQRDSGLARDGTSELVDRRRQCELDSALHLGPQ